MKRVTLTAAFLTVLNALASGQPSTPPSTTHRQSSSKVDWATTLVSSAQPTDEFRPLNNLPFFPGGPRALEAYLQNVELYPYRARETGVEGSVHIRFRVMPTGYLTQFEVVRSGGPLLDYAALDAVSGMPRWYPAHRAGTAVSSLYELIITFRLD